MDNKKEKGNELFKLIFCSLFFAFLFSINFISASYGYNNPKNSTYGYDNSQIVSSKGGSSGNITIFQNITNNYINQTNNITNNFTTPIKIGDPVLNGNNNDVLFIDGMGNLGNSNFFNYQNAQLNLTQVNGIIPLLVSGSANITNNLFLYNNLTDGTNNISIAQLLTAYNYNSTGLIRDWNSSSLIINWSNVITQVNYNSSGLILNWTNQADHNESGLIKDWNMSGFIQDWNQTGLILNWSNIITGGSGITNGSSAWLQNLSLSGDFLVDNGLIFANATSNFVGINNTNPKNTLSTQLGSVNFTAGSLGNGFFLNNTVFNFSSFNQTNFGYFMSNINSYSQVWLQNINSGTNVSQDLVITSSNGTNANNYLDLGINGQFYNDTLAYGNVYNATGPNDGYLYVQDGDLTVGTTTVGRDFQVATGGFNIPNIRMTISGTNGYVGINTTNAQNTLNVVGEINSTGNAYFGGILFVNQTLSSGFKSYINLGGQYIPPGIVFPPIELVNFGSGYYSVNNFSSAALRFYRARDNGSIGAYSVLASDELGEISFSGYNLPSNSNGGGSSIRSYATKDYTISGSNSADLQFWTTDMNNAFYKSLLLNNSEIVAYNASATVLLDAGNINKTGVGNGANASITYIQVGMLLNLTNIGNSKLPPFTGAGNQGSFCSNSTNSVFNGTIMKNNTGVYGCPMTASANWTKLF